MREKNKGDDLPQNIESLVVSEITRQRLNNLTNSHQVNYGSFDQILRKVLEKLGIKIQPVNSLPLFSQIKEHLEITMAELGKLPSVAERLDGDTDLALFDWIEKDSELEFLHKGNYAKIGAIHAQFHLRGDRSVPGSFAVLLRFRSEPHFLLFEYVPIRCDWDITVRGKGAEELTATLRQKTYEYLNREYQGKELGIRLRPIELQKRSRKDLVYSERMSIEVDNLCRVFQNWLLSSFIKQWCYLLTGDVGCGKTTLGGLLVGLKSPECTVIYCHSSEIEHGADDIARIFRTAQKLSPTLLIIDDLHLLFRDAYRSGLHYTGALMECLDSLKEKNAKVFVLFTANSPELLDPALQYRPGRISHKIAFGDYSGCLSKLLQLCSQEVGLNIGREEINEAIGILSEDRRILTPDEVKNVCEYLHLLNGEESVSPQILADAVSRVYEEYHIHGDKASLSEVTIAKKGGEDQEF